VTALRLTMMSTVLANVSDTIKAQQDFQPYFEQQALAKQYQSLSALQGSDMWLLSKFVISLPALATGV
jgi:hypothetical protein